MLLIICVFIHELTLCPFSHKGLCVLMVAMSQKEYLALIEDTLSYVRQLQPKIEKRETEIELPPLPTLTKPPPRPKANPISYVTHPPQPLKKKEQKNLFFELEPAPVPRTEASLTIQKILKEIDPELYLHESVPNDHKAKRIKEAWKEKRDTPAIPILFQGQKHRSFVTRIAKAIDILYDSCRIVEIDPTKKWDLFLESENLKLIITPDATLFGTKELLPFYQENPQQKSRKLGKIPLLLLPDLSLYFKDPYLKRALWNVIKSALS